MDSIPGSGRSPGGEHGNPPQYSCLENPHRQRNLVSYNPWGAKEQAKRRAFLVAQLVKNLPAMQETPVRFLGQEVPLEKGEATHSCIPGLLSDDKGSACNVGDLGLIPGLGRSVGGGHGNPLQYSCLENPHRQRSLEGYNPWGGKVRHD